mmetsp:Transcript_23770/g.33260  ORF Transcript_23770/g.33260 Transcript_23770/m.33260 type:complete len:263 (+) Transcript_23770:188-976(+)|eukprot:CAMPEP_0184490792 /NCGR_PEP_ID=MMETSP0113_2-20130426/18883_1 /TAXON_ID=91329 /ORGANISM="Norrisiella sphaerica, Strain BC52" /LENGTH=262 /DNA_ID=CAMNT_0026874871 /DNA_START=155 /DNA_END=943 /DNA_ORIENTATION=+
MEEHYHVLELSPDADAKAIKKAFRRLSLKHHPDKGGSAEMMAKINKAHSILGSEERRKQYDQLGVDWETDEDEEKKMMEELRVIMEPLGMYLVRLLIGSAYVFFMQYFWTNVLITIAGSALLIQGGVDKTESSKIVIPILCMGWISRIGPWLHFFVEMLVLWIMFFLAFEGILVLGAGGLISMFLSWWFAGRIFYYIIVLLIGVVLYLLVWLFLMISVAGRQAAANQKLERFTAEVKPKVRALRNEIASLKRQLAQERAKKA